MKTHLLLQRMFIALVLLAALPLFAATAVVINTNDSGPGSLRAALTAAAGGTVDRIEFSIGSGPQTIQPLTELPSASTTPVTIDGTTQPGYSGTPLIEIDGSLVAGNWFDVAGLQVRGDVLGLAIGNFVGSAIVIDGGSIRGCHLGTDRTGTIARPNAFGVFTGYGPNEITIGGPNPGDGNLISGNSAGVRIATQGRTSIQGNTFGSDLTQNVQIGNSYHVTAQNQNGIIAIGGEAPNVFVGASTAIDIFYTHGAAILRNYIGVTPAGKVIPNQIGVYVYQSNDTTISGNTIRGNAIGVIVSGNSLRNQILENSISGNTFGIDLSTGSLGSPTPNDAGDGDTGPNNLINFPVLDRAKVGVSTMLTGSLSTAPNRTNRVDLFSSPTCNSSGYGEGRDWLGGYDVTTDATGQASFSFELPWMAPGTIITATATTAVEGTSEFSRCVAVEGPGIFSFQNATVSAPENGFSTIVTVRRANGAVGAATVDYAVAGGTATGGADFTGGSGALLFADGETQKSFTVTPVNDAVYEGSETIILALSDPTGGTEVGSPNTTTITINDNDPPPAVTIHDLEVVEGNAGNHVAQARFTLASPASAPVNLHYSLYSWTAVAGSDFVSGGGTVTFLPGETEKFAAITIVGDTTHENDELFEIYSSSSGSAVVTIVNDDPQPTVSAGNLTVVEGDVTSTATITLTATQPLFGAVQVSLVPLNARSPADFTATSTFVAFNGQTTRSVNATIVGDDEPEPNEAFRVVLHRLSGMFDVAGGVVTIANDDTGVGPAERSIAAGSTGAFTVQLGEAYSQDLTLTLTTDAPDAVSVPAMLVIPAGSAGTEFEVVALLPGRTAIISVTLPALLGGTTHQVRAHTYTKATLQFTPAHLELIQGQTANVTVSVNPANAMTIGLVAAGGVQVPSSLTIPAGGSATFNVKALRTGAFTIDAQLPAEHGSEVQSLYGDVRSTPSTPAILGITPAYGPTSGGTAVSISGANFRAGCTLTFGGVPASAVQFVNATTMTAVTPAHAAGGVAVMLRCGEEVMHFANGFAFVSESPLASEVLPRAGTTTGGTHVRVSGNNFDSSCWVFFGSNAATQVVMRDENNITVVTPARAPGTVDVTVRCSGGTYAIPGAYEFNNATIPTPFVSSSEPSAAAPGEVVTIRGLDLRPDVAVTFATTPATILDSTPTTLVVRVPELPAGPVSVTLTDHLGRTSTSGPVFSVLEARPPRITSLAPSVLPAGGELALGGEGFRPGYTFEVGGRRAAIVDMNYSHVVLRLAGDTPVGSHPVQVRNSSGVLAAVGLNVQIAANGLTVSSVDPRCASTDGGIFATIHGRGFTPAVTVSFDLVPATDLTLLDPTMLRVRIPAGTAGPARIIVADATSDATLTNGFTYDSPFAPGDSCGGRTRAARH